MSKVKSLVKTLEEQKNSLDEFLNSKKQSSWKPIAIKKIIERTQNYQKQEIEVGGWVKTTRQGKFIKISDGSSLETLQLVCSLELASQLKAIKFGSYLMVKGKLELTPEREQSCELKVSKILFIGSQRDDYPLQKQKMPLGVIREHAHLRPKTNYFLALFRLRHSISKALHDFFDQEGFYYTPAPLITSNDSEGAGEVFNVTTNEKEPFFPTAAKLTVSGQLHAEALAQGLGKVYTFAPCFRAEKSHTTRHLAEFWMVEAEWAPTDLTSLIKFTERLIKSVIRYTLKEHPKELEYLEKYHQKEIISKLKKLQGKDFIQLEYTHAIEILKGSSDIEWGMDLKSEHEKYLCHHYREQPIFITDYPRDLKAFYMKNNSDGKTVACFDLLFPEIGELVGGSLREDNYQILQEKAQKIGLDTDNLAWYFDLRKTGYAPSGGFGLGLERLIMYISDTENIRDTIAFPRYPKHLEF